MTDESLSNDRSLIPVGEVAVCQYGLSEPADPSGDRMYIGMGQLQNGRVVAKNANRLTVSASIAERYALRRGDVLFNRTNSLELVGKTALVSDGAIVGSVFASYLVRLQVDSTKYDSRFLNLWMNTPDSVQRLRRLATPGVAQFNIRPSLLSTKFLVPAWPLRKQRAVADLEQHFESAIHAIELLVVDKKKFKRGLMLQLLTGQMRFPAFAGESKKAAALKEFLTLTLRPVAKPSQAYRSLGIRSHGRGTFEHEAKNPASVAMDTLYEVITNDLILNITFGWEGAVAIVKKGDEGALVSHRFPTFCIDETKVCVQYIAQVIKTRRFVHSLGLVSPGGAGRNRVLDKDDFLSIAIWLPSLAEQRAISDLLDCCDRELGLLEALREKIECQKRAFISRLLSGDLTISQ